MVRHMGLQMNIDEIEKILPHRYPFLLIDRIVDGEEGKWAKGIKCVSAEITFLPVIFRDIRLCPES